MPGARIDPRPQAPGRRFGHPALPGVGGRHEDGLLGALVLAIGSVWIGVPLLALVEGAEPPLGLGVAGTCVLPAVGIGLLLWGLDLLIRRRTVIIEDDVLHVLVRGLTGVRRWREPLANYRGLRHRRSRVRHRYGWRVVHRLELAHPDPAKEIDLPSVQGERQTAAAWRRWAESLGLPVWSTNASATREPAYDLAHGAFAPQRLPSFAIRPARPRSPVLGPRGRAPPLQTGRGDLATP